MAIKRAPNESYEHRDYVKTPIKNDTYEYRKFINRPKLNVEHVEIGLCTEEVLMKQLKKPFNGRFYHTTDTNKFFFDWNGKRYELNIFGGSGGDMSEYAKKKDIPKKVSQLVNDANFMTITSLKKFLNDNQYVTMEMLRNSISNFVTKDEFNNLFLDVNSLRDEIDALKRRVAEISSEDASDDELDVIRDRIKKLEDECDYWDEFNRE